MLFLQHADCVEALIETEADATQNDNAAIADELAMYIQTLTKTGAEVNNADKNGFTALLMSAENEFTALLKSAENGCTEFVANLLKAGEDANLVNHKGCTALMLAAHKGRSDIATTLLEAGAHVNVADTDTQL